MAKNAKKGTKKAKKPRRQPDLPAMEGPGVEQKQIIEIDEIADEYVVARDERMAQLEKEVAAKARLKAVMVKHTLKVYDYDGYIVEIEPGEETIKVKKKKTPREELESGEDD